MNIARDSVVLLDFEAPDEKSAVLKVASLLEGDAAVTNYASFRTAIWERQCLQAPLLGNGVALPHARTGAVSEMVFAIGRLRTPVPFGKEQVPVTLIILYGSPSGQVAPSLAVIAELAKKLHRPEILSGLMQAPTDADFRKLLA